MPYGLVERGGVRARGLVCYIALGWVLVACTGSIASGDGDDTGEAGPVDAPPGATPGGGGPGDSPGGGPTDPNDPRITQRIWRLSPTELNQEIERLFGAGVPTIAVPQSAAQAGITNIADNAVIDQGNASIFVDGVRAVAQWVVDGGTAHTRCASYGDDECVTTLLGWLPREAFRRPVTDAEAAELSSLFERLRDRFAYDYAFAGVIRAVLLSPAFLYRTELNPVLAPHEIANLLAFALTGGAPDAELSAVTDLADPDVREAQARRLMERSAKVWQRFFWEWLHMSTLYSQGTEVGLPPALVAQMEAEYHAFIEEVVVNQRGTLGDVLSAPYTWAEPELAAHYGATHGGSGLERIDLNSSERGGVLTQGAWLVSHGKDGHDNVVRRGMGIYRDAMCNSNLRPPDGVDVQAELAKLVGPDATVRETVDARGSAAACSGCHRLPDPMGMVFETFTSDGRFQDIYPDGMPIDSNVTVQGLGDFDDARMLSAALADDETFQRCLVQRFAHLAFGVDLGTPARVAWTATAQARLAETGGNLEEMMVAWVRHPAFIERRTEEAP